MSQFKPSVVIIDPISNLTSAGKATDVQAVLLRLVDYLKTEQITAFFTSLNSGGSALEGTDVSISSLIDTWLLLRDIEIGGERNRGLYVLKSRGMSHSHQIREFLLTNRGIDLLEVYSGPDGVLTGSMRSAQEQKERAALLTRKQEFEHRQRELDRKRKILEAQIAALNLEFEAVEDEAQIIAGQDLERRQRLEQDRDEMGARRGGAPSTGPVTQSKERS